ncbi:hypothetical protein [Alkalihalobacillus sp. CinArs1]|uniref:hypothetical protein n=1 Tax=Alkalihalobacillus sp. CinArs1 TaxID=2995314 RepID=UPI0022DE54F8|nr:hypothetical protein [Alkalihalobacillus sp. CinArs1]
MDLARLNRIQHLAYDIMDEMNKEGSSQDCSHSNQVIDLLSRAIGNLTDPNGSFSIDYVEEKVATAHYLLFKNEKKVPALIREKGVTAEK